jgi:hypothetical protein
MLALLTALAAVNVGLIVALWWVCRRSGALDPI